MKIQEFFHPGTSTLTYAVYDETTRDALVIDPVLDYDPASARITDAALEKLITFLVGKKLKVHLILETHAHADHLSGARVLKEACPGAKLGIGRHIVKVLETFKKVFNLEGLRTDGGQFDVLLDEGKDIAAGTLVVKTLFTPGHTPACASYLIGDALFAGDALFMPDSGTGRCDFPGGSAAELYRSITEKVYSLPGKTRVFVGHDYQPEGRGLAFQCTVDEEKAANIRLKGDTSREDFVAAREARDKTMEAPRLLWPSVQVNIAGGELPAPEANGTRYLKIPLSE